MTARSVHRGHRTIVAGLVAGSTACAAIAGIPTFTMDDAGTEGGKVRLPDSGHGGKEAGHGGDATTHGSASRSGSTGGSQSSSTSSGSSGSSGTTSASGSGSGSTSGSPVDDAGSDGATRPLATVYAHTDTELYALNPTTNLVTPVGVFVFPEDAAAPAITDLAVNAAGVIYVCTETVLYTVALPDAPALGASVVLTTVTTLSTGVNRFYALGIVPATVLGPDEVLIGGDGNGILWALPSTSSGNPPQALGSFGADPDVPNNQLTLSGDIVFYTNLHGAVEGLATIRSCSSAGATQSCVKTNDYLASINMANLGANYDNNNQATSLLASIYGGSTGQDGPGTGYGEIFGLAVAGSSVYGFTRVRTAVIDAGGALPQVVLLSTSTGTGMAINESLGFTGGGWSGAGVATTVSVNLE